MHLLLNHCNIKQFIPILHFIGGRNLISNAHRFSTSQFSTYYSLLFRLTFLFAARTTPIPCTQHIKTEYLSY